MTQVSLNVGRLKGGTLGNSEWGIGDPRGACGRDRNGFLGEKIFEIGSAVRAAFQRWEEAGRRKLGPGDHRAAAWPGIGEVGLACGSLDNSHSWAMEGSRAGLALAL